MRNQGRFATKLALERYPFDKHKLRIDLEDSTEGTGSQIYKPHGVAVSMSPDLSSLPGFRIGASRMVIRNNRYPTNFGDTTVADQEA